jgi:hypothetical protein
MMWRRDRFFYIHNRYHINIPNQEDLSKKGNGQQLDVIQERKKRLLTYCDLEDNLHNNFPKFTDSHSKRFSYLDWRSTFSRIILVIIFSLCCLFHVLEDFSSFRIFLYFGLCSILVFHSLFLLFYFYSYNMLSFCSFRVSLQIRSNCNWINNSVFAINNIINFLYQRVCWFYAFRTQFLFHVYCFSLRQYRRPKITCNYSNRSTNTLLLYQQLIQSLKLGKSSQNIDETSI